jgi:hypothetical protein
LIFIKKFYLSKIAHYVNLSCHLINHVCNNARSGHKLGGGSDRSWQLLIVDGL